MSDTGPTPVYQRDTEQQTLLKSISSYREEIPVWEQLATDQTDPWQVVPRQVFTPHSRLLISTVFVVVSRVGCLGVTGVGPLCWCYLRPLPYFYPN